MIRREPLCIEPPETNRYPLCRHLRSTYVYPGHPLVIAVCIMEKYPDLDAALTRARAVTRGVRPRYYAALGDGDIPGSGSAVNDAIAILQIAKTDVDTAVLRAAGIWLGACIGAHAKYLNAGQKQADELEELFRSKVADWMKNKPITDISF